MIYVNARYRDTITFESFHRNWEFNTIASAEEHVAYLMELAEDTGDIMSLCNISLNIAF